MSQKFKSEVELQALNAATTDTDKFLVSDGGIIKFRTGAEMLSDLGVAPGVASNIQHQVKAGVAINKGQAVYVSSADGTNMIVSLASNAAEATSSKTMGLLASTVAINGFANVIVEGLLAGLNTSTATAGDPVWLGTGGNLIYGLVNKPYAPAHLVFIGIVTRVNANNGEIFVKVQNGFELDELHDVDLKSLTPVSGHILGFNGNLWVNKTIAAWLGYTPQVQLNGTGFVKASGTTITYDNTSYYPSSNPNGYISSYSETDTLQSVVNRGASSSTQITLSGAGNNSTTYSSLRFAGYNQGGGVGYHGFFEIQNTYGSVTNGKKFFRIDGSGTLQIINSAYTNNIFNLTDAGDLTTTKFIKSGGTAAQILAADGSVITAGSNITISGGVISSTGGAAYTHPAYTARNIDTSGAQVIDIITSDAIGSITNITTRNLTPGDIGAQPAGSYLTSETDTLQSVTNRGATTNLAITSPNYVFTGASSGAVGLVTSTSSFGTRSSDGTTYGYGISTNINGGLDIMANQSGQPIRFWAGTTNVSPIQRMIISAGDVTATDSFRSPIFYDSNNTGYYVDPNNTSNLNIVRAANRLTGAWIGVDNTSATSGNGISLYNGSAAGQPTYGIMFAGTATFGTHGSVTSDWATYLTMSDTTTRGWIFKRGTTNVASISGTGILTVNGDVRAPIFYDSNNTGYYCDPTSTSNLVGLTVANTISGNITGNSGTVSSITGNTGLMVNSLAAPALIDGLTTANFRSTLFGTTSNGYQISTARWNNVPAPLGGLGAYGTMLSWSGSDTHGFIAMDYSAAALRVGGGNANNINWTRQVIIEDAWVNSKYLASDGRIYGTIFYDANDSTYWVDPAGSTTSANFLSKITIQGGSNSATTMMQVVNNYGNPSLSSYYGILHSSSAFYAGNPTGTAYAVYGSDAQFYTYYDRNNTAYYFDGSNTGDSIRVAGDIVAYYSDDRLKDRKGNIENALEKVLSLNGFYYEANQKAQELGYKKKMEVGVSAQEVEAILPELIKDAPIGQGYKTLDYGRLTPLLIEAIKDQQKQIEELKELVNKLTTK